MRLEDLPEVAEIEGQSYLTPWPEGSFLECLREGHYCRVGEGDGGRVEAYAIMSVEVGVAHLLNICVREDLRGQGLARHLLSHLLAAVRPEAHTVILEVRASNRRAIRLYKTMGFAQVSVRRNYYPGKEGREDALILCCRLPQDGRRQSSR
ncbi:MAG: ribosomal protein S18-alanine N-acetyltransferase [Acidobacteriota bacterium]